MLSRILLGSFLATTSLAVIPSAKAGFDEYGNLRISVRRLQKGYEEGTLTLKDGTRFSVAKANEWSMPCFSMIYDQNMKIGGYYGREEYIFNHMEGGGPRYFQNPQTLEWEYDYNQIDPGMECLGLVLKKLATQPLNEIISESPSLHHPVPSVEILLDPKGKEEKVSSKEEEPSSLPKKIPGKIFKESDTSKNTAQKDFYIQYDEKRNVWIGIEYLTPKAATWWEQRLGWDAHMHFGKQIEREQLSVFLMPEETKVSIQKSSMEFAESMSMIFGGSSSNSTDLIPRYVREAEEFCSLRSSGFTSGKEFVELYDEKAPKDPWHPQNDNYLSAWRGFQYNLKHAHKRPTWITYISSKPTEGPLYETVSVTSPDIKMMMTATPGDKFYSPLGIYKSPIATAYDEKVGQKYGQLSMPLHGATARFMRQIQPEMQYMVVRPLVSMGSIFGKTKVPYSSSNGGRQDQKETHLPYIRCTTPFQHRWYDEPEKLTPEEEESFGKSPYVLIDSRTNEYHQMSNQHWFSESPFLGGQTRDFFETFPFVTVDVEDLGKF